LLVPAEQALFRCLAVFADGCALAAADVVGGDVDEGSSAAPAAFSALDGLESLVSKSLVRRDARDDEARYSLLTTIQEYALEQLLAHGQTAARRDRHAAFFLRRAETAEPQLSGAQQATWLDRLEREQANLRAALDWAA